MNQKNRRALIRELQEDLPECPAPFAEIARKIGQSEAEVLAEIRSMQEEGTIRRFGVMMRHRELGISANGMGVWTVPRERTEEVGAIMASFEEVSHCYQRPVFPGWPYNLFTMIHAPSREECRETARRISEKTGITEFKLLFSTRELKKSSMKYFV
ncbi:MAG: AsnC family transcriptional regulator [bacterium]